MIVSEFTAALDLDTYPSASNLVKLCSVFLTDISIYFEPIYISIRGKTIIMIRTSLVKISFCSP